MKAIVNANIITENGLVQGQAVLFNDKIQAVIPRNQL
jgi:N-acetylglucosamine-6-phosphate deacetylase